METITRNNKEPTILKEIIIKPKIEKEFENTPRHKQKIRTKKIKEKEKLKNWWDESHLEKGITLKTDPSKERRNSETHG